MEKNVKAVQNIRGRYRGKNQISFRKRLPTIINTQLALVICQVLFRSFMSTNLFSAYNNLKKIDTIIFFTSLMTKLRLRVILEIWLQILYP